MRKTQLTPASVRLEQVETAIEIFNSQTGSFLEISRSFQREDLTTPPDTENPSPTDNCWVAIDLYGTTEEFTEFMSWNFMSDNQLLPGLDAYVTRPYPGLTNFLRLKYEKITSKLQKEVLN